MFKGSFRKFGLFLFLAAAASACSSGTRSAHDPKQTLTEYISKSFAVREAADRKDLAEYLTGDAKNRLFAWSDEQFSEAFVESKRQFVKLAFHEVKSPTPQQAHITYELTYMDSRKGADMKVTNKKLCQLIQQNGRWYISEVKNIKELIEYRNEMSLP